MKSIRLANPPVDEEAATHADDAADRWRLIALQGAIIVLAGLWIYSPAYHGDWLWDDDQLLTANPVVQSGSLRGLAKLWFNPDGADFFPLSYTALWAQWPFFKLSSTGYHVTSILLHIVSALLLWALFARMRIPGAWFGGLIFTIHPICVESVAWVSETKNTLSMPLFLLSCLCWVAQDEEREARRRNRLYALSILFFLLAMFAKTSMVAFPVVLLLHAWWKRGTVTTDDVVRTLPFFAISVVLGLITIQYQHGRAIGSEKIPVGGLASRIATAGMAILFYLWQIVWPVHPMPIYPRWEVDPPKVWQFLPWPVILGAAAWLWNRRGSAARPGWERHALFGLGFFLLMVAPVLGFVTISYMRITWVADHFVYLPIIGVIGLAAAGVAGVYAAAGGRAGATGAAAAAAAKASTSRPLLIGATTIALAAFAIRSFIYAHAWAGEDQLWTYTLKLNHNAWQAHNRLGARKFSRGEIDSAYYHFTQSTRLRPDLGETHNNLGTALSAKGRLDEAIKEFAEASRLIPDNLTMMVNLANALYQRGRFQEAAETFGKMVVQQPQNPALLNNYAVALYRAGDKNAAVANFRRALELNPDLKDARDGLAVALGEKPDPALQKPQSEMPQQPRPVAPPPASPTGAVPVLPGQSTLGPAPLAPQSR